MEEGITQTPGTWKYQLGWRGVCACVKCPLLLHPPGSRAPDGLTCLLFAANGGPSWNDTLWVSLTFKLVRELMGVPIVGGMAAWGSVLFPVEGLERKEG